MRARSCLCGCGQEVTGQRSKRFYSDGCRKRFDRSGRALEPSQRTPAKRESRTPPEPATGAQNVRESDTEVRCSGCWSVMPRLEGPLPVPTYCRRCVPNP